MGENLIWVVSADNYPPIQLMDNDFTQVDKLIQDGKI